MRVSSALMLLIMSPAVLPLVLLLSSPRLLQAGEAETPSKADVAEAVGRATVTIRCSHTDGTESSGSGFVVDPEGVVVTNYHVVHGCSRLEVRMGSGDIFDVARVHALDPKKDLALVRIPGFSLPTVLLGNSDEVRKGDSVLVLGTPLGMLEGSVSSGVISAIRNLESLRVFQMDAAASHGNSGGPVVDDAGRVVGVTSFKLAAGESLNFAIPINYVRGLLAVDQHLDLESLVAEEHQGSLFEETSAEEGIPKRWKSLSTGGVFRVRVEGDYIYVEREVSAEERQLKLFSAGEAKKDGDQWTGTWRHGGNCRYGDGVWTTFKWSFCTSTAKGAITLLTPTRIEGWTLSYPPNTKFKCKTCTYVGSKQRYDFLWVPYAP